MNANPIIYILEKNPIHRNLISYRLGLSGFNRVHAFSEISECMYHLERRERPDFFIIDYDTVSDTGPKIVFSIKAMAPAVHLIFFTTADDPQIATELLENGATDYILKSTEIQSSIPELIKNIRFISKDLYYGQKAVL